MNSLNKKNKKQSLKKSVSMCSLQSQSNDTFPTEVVVYNKEKGFYGYSRFHSRTISDSSVDICLINDSESDDDDKGKRLADSGIGEKMVSDSDILMALERKIDRLSDMFLEQCRLLTTLKEEINNSKTIMEKAGNTQNQMLGELVKKSIAQSFKEFKNQYSSEGEPSPAKSLLDAIEFKQGVSVNREIKDALASFLQSDDLKDHMVQATAKSVKDVIGNCFSRDVSTLYLPILEHSHRRLVRHISKVVEEAFIELEQNSASLSKSVNKVSKSLHRALERHQNLLEAAADPDKNCVSTVQCAVEELLHKELKHWREKVLDLFSSQLQAEKVCEGVESPPPSLDYPPISPPQPADPERSIIDQLMISAEINKQIQDGDINGAFEKALSASDLSLVTAACRAADPARVFASGGLQQHVLLALVQQLATDMVHETHLKCRYLEDAIVNLNSANHDARAHLPLVVGEVRKHLTTFLSSYPNHVASRRISLIVRAANNLLK